PLTPFGTNAFSNYLSHYNSLRVAKGFAWALLFLPLLRRSLGADSSNLQRYFIPGMLLGLTGACLAVVWERAVFPGLLNFSSDYRPTAPFSAMHTGGAALDAYLAIAFPFIAAWLIDTKSRLHLVLGISLLLLGCYAGFAMFSRDIYLAFGLSGLIVITFAFASRLRQGGGDKRLQVVGTAVLIAILIYVLSQVFATSGYRGLATSLGLIGAGFILCTVESRLKHVGVVTASAIALILINLGLFFFSDSTALIGMVKGSYLGFLLSAGLFGLGTLFLFFGQQTRKLQGLAIAAAAFPGMALTTGLVAFHWGGNPAISDILILIALVLGVIAVNRLLPQPVWHFSRHTMTFVFFCMIVFATAIPIASSYYLGTRFSTVNDDLSVRVRHWREALSMMTPDWETSVFGMGLGRYPETYFWKNTHDEIPGTYSYETEKDDLFLRLGAPQYAIGYGEALRILQHVDVNPDRHYRLSLDVRRPSGNEGISISICERWLLYPQNCVGAPVKLMPADNAWHHYDLPWNSGHLGEHPWFSPIPIQLEISSYGSDSYLDVDNISLLDTESGAELVRNGSFTHGNDFWFFSSDRNHFPWHIKNFFVNTFFELGWMGLISISLLIVYVTGNLIFRGARGEQTAGIFLASLAGCLVVGLFDSLFDVPKLTLLFFLVIFVATLRPIKIRIASSKAPKLYAVEKL
ncbi:MAG TPA: hypothetical protein VK832_06565, partial [Burkholderiaceae bacterium]|nr:hypothetical protein [Burkholderiaceae bacterium]